MRIQTVKKKQLTAAILKKGLAVAIKKAKHKKGRTEPLWKGPEEDGVTQSMLNDFLFCRERFRVQNILGWTTPDEFKPALEYGNMWHLCEEVWNKQNGESMAKVRIALKKFTLSLCKQYPLQQEQVSKSYNICLRQFPVYVEYWEKHQQRRKQETLLTEHTFKVSYKLPSGRTVLLRGKWDEVIAEGPKKQREIWVKEHKTKGTIEEETIKRQLTFDLQTMTYLVALHEFQYNDDLIPYADPIKGVIYNVIRRPLSGGKGNIKLLQNANKGKKNANGKALPARPEGLEEYYNRAAQYWIDEPEAYFFRWKVEVTPEEIEAFKSKFLTPILEQLCDWYKWIQQGGVYWGHWQTPFGIWNPLAKGLSTEYDRFVETGSTIGLVQNDRLFKELD